MCSSDLFDSEIKVYPNPTNEFVIIDLENSYKDIAIQITNISGQAVVEQNFANAQNIEINTTELAKGTYLIKITAEGKVAILKLTKN